MEQLYHMLEYYPQPKPMLLHPTETPHPPSTHQPHAMLPVGQGKGSSSSPNQSQCLMVSQGCWESWTAPRLGFCRLLKQSSEAKSLQRCHLPCLPVFGVWLKVLVSGATTSSVLLTQHLHPYSSGEKTGKATASIRASHSRY